MQEKTSPVYVVATANSVRRLPPELLRKGRFDEIFFVDLPSSSDREEIFRVHLTAVKRDPAMFDLTAMSRATQGFSGSDIEAVVRDALEHSFLDGAREPTTPDFVAMAKNVVPLSKTMGDEIEALREWATSRARLASRPRLEIEGAQGPQHTTATVS
jgi:SpoVK/Ycf46/Vps4 family AAA+-type ATPase